MQERNQYRNLVASKVRVYTCRTYCKQPPMCKLGICYEQGSQHKKEAIMYVYTLRQK